MWPEARGWRTPWQRREPASVVSRALSPIENVNFIPFDSCVDHVISSFPRGFSDLLSLKSLSNSSKYDSVINLNMTVKNTKCSPMSMSTPHRYLLVKIIFGESMFAGVHIYSSSQEMMT